MDFVGYTFYVAMLLA